MGQTKGSVPVLFGALLVTAAFCGIWPIPKRGEDPPFPLDVLLGIVLLMWEGIKWVRRRLRGGGRVA